MSNTQVGNVYQQIISDVIDSSRVDFEEGGVDESVLEHLRMVRLSLSPSLLLLPSVRIDSCVVLFPSIIIFVLFFRSLYSHIGK